MAKRASWKSTFRPSPARETDASRAVPDAVARAMVEPANLRRMLF
jgi:hypothetical protein